MACTHQCRHGVSKLNGCQSHKIRIWFCQGLRYFDSPSSINLFSTSSREFPFRTEKSPEYRAGGRYSRRVNNHLGPHPIRPVDQAPTPIVSSTMPVSNQLECSPSFFIFIMFIGKSICRFAISNTLCSRLKTRTPPITANPAIEVGYNVSTIKHVVVD